MLVEYENLSKSNKEFEFEYKKRVDEVIASGWYILGKQVEEFESRYAKLHNVKHCIALNSGLDALILGLKAANLPKDGEVLVAANSYLACVLSIIQAGLKPVLVEPNIENYNIDEEILESKITSKTVAIMPVHLYGRACNMEKIMQIAAKHKLFIIEDCAQAHLAKQNGKLVGTFGDIGAFSFYPTKNLGSIGDSGCIITNDDNYAAKIRSMRNYGFSKVRYVADNIGINSRMDELQAAFLNVKLDHLEKINTHKRQLANIYNENIRNINIIKPLSSSSEYEHIYHIYNIRAEKRDELQQYLKENGVATIVHYPIPPHKQEALADFFKGQNFPIADKIANTTLSLPISYMNNEGEVLKVCELMNNV